MSSKFFNSLDIDDGQFDAHKKTTEFFFFFFFFSIITTLLLRFVINLPCKSLSFLDVFEIEFLVEYFDMFVDGREVKWKVQARIISQ